MTTDLELAEEIERMRREAGGRNQFALWLLTNVDEIIAALRRGPERPDVNDLLDFIEAVAVKLMVPLVPRDGFSKRILDKLDWLILALNKYSEEDILQERPPSGEMVMVPSVVYDALKVWTGTEPSQSVLARVVDKWLSAAEAEGRKPYAHIMGACPLCGRADPHSHTSGPLGMS